jgi:hypothetical protein
MLGPQEDAEVICSVQAGHKNDELKEQMFTKACLFQFHSAEQKNAVASSKSFLAY